MERKEFIFVVSHAQCVNGEYTHWMRYYFKNWSLASEQMDAILDVTNRCDLGGLGNVKRDHEASSFGDSVYNLFDHMGEEYYRVVLSSEEISTKVNKI